MDGNYANVVVSIEDDIPGICHRFPTILYIVYCPVTTVVLLALTSVKAGKGVIRDVDTDASTKCRVGAI